ncbi:MAG: glycosyltransferase family 39 protein [Ignavibacteriae bacterium]|nr:glycosyltransferase family 39 protein [Ignavibacteriota bacterium]
MFKKDVIPISVILTFALSMRLWNIHWSLPEIYEEAYPFHIAWKFWNWEGNSFDFNPHFFNYPALTFYLQFIIQAAHYLVGNLFGVYPNVTAYQQTYFTDPTSFILVGRLLSVVFDVGTIFLVYIIAKKYMNEITAFLAAVLLSVNPIHIKQSHVISVDSALTFFSVLSLFFIMKIYTEPKKKWYVLSGVAIGLAAASKYNGALLLLVFLIAHLLKSTSQKNKILFLANYNLITGIVLSGVVFVLLNPFILTHFDEFYYSFSFEQFHVSAGHLGVDPNQNTVSYYLLDVIPSSVGLPLALAVLFSIVQIFYMKKKENILLLLFPFIYLGVLVSWEMRAERYALPVLPFIILFGSSGVIELTMLFKERYLKKLSPLFFKFIVLPLLGLVFIIPPAIGSMKYQLTHSLPDTRTIAKEWLRQNIKPMVTIATVPLGMELKEKGLFVLQIPYHPVLPHIVEPFYEFQFYKDLDLIIGSSFDYDRYILDPQRYKKFISFYDSLKTNSTLLYTIKPGEHRNGPTFWFYRPIQDSLPEYFDTVLMNQLEQVENKQAVVNFAGKLGVMLSLKNKLLKSEQMFRLALKNNGSHTEARKQLTKVLQRQEKKKEALEEMTIYLSQNPKDVEMLAERGEIYLEFGQLDESEKDLLRAIELDRKLESAYLNLSIIYGVTAKKNKMIGILERYLTILPPNSERYNLVVSQIEKVKTF